MKRFKSAFPIRVGCGYRLNVVDNHLIIEKRGLIRFWHWKVIVREPLSYKGVKDIQDIANKRPAIDI